MSTSTVIEAVTPLHITRKFQAPRDRVFAAFATFEAMKSWFGPGSCNVYEGTLDFRVGGSYLLKLDTDHGKMAVGGEYREINPPAKIVFTWKWLDDEDWENIESVVSFEFIAQGSATELRMTHTGFPNSESRGRHEHGWSGGLENLEKYLASA